MTDQPHNNSDHKKKIVESLENDIHEFFASCIPFEPTQGTRHEMICNVWKGSRLRKNGAFWTITRWNFQSSRPGVGDMFLDITVELNVAVRDKKEMDQIISNFICNANKSSFPKPNRFTPHERENAVECKFLFTYEVLIPERLGG